MVGGSQSRMRNGKANGNRPIHGLAAFEIITPKPEETVIGGVISFEPVIMTVATHPLAEMKQPKGRDGHTQDENL